jgi:PTH1 family peptidyl-tRNA hydrolase
MRKLQDSAVDAMLLFVGLGNPGSRYIGNRHNIGFMAVQAIARRFDISPWRRRFQGVAVEGSIAGARVMLLLPGTFMNESGRAVAEAANFYKLEPANVVVFHDEVELPPGKVRLKLGGGNAGHNGLRSISDHIGNDYRRVRFGVGHPGDKNLMEQYVLQDFAKSEWPWVEALCEIVAENAALLIEGKDSTFQNKVHLAMAAKGFGEEDEPPGSE